VYLEKNQEKSMLRNFFALF